MNNTALILCLTALALGGCSSDEPVAKDELIIKHQIQALEKAKQVEDMLQQVEQKRRRRMEEQGI